jgi:peptidyl-prolyl cis-trans isomerase A (cyclophilin A)
VLFLATTREHAADLGAAALQRTLAEIEERLTSLSTLPPAGIGESASKLGRLQDGAALVVFSGSGASRYFGAPLPYYPVAPTTPEPPPDVFSPGEALEFQKRDPAGAIRAFRELAGSKDPAVRAGALMRLGRNYRKAGDFSGMDAGNWRELTFFSSRNRPGTGLAAATLRSPIAWPLPPQQSGCGTNGRSLSSRAHAQGTIDSDPMKRACQILLSVITGLLLTSCSSTPEPQTKIEKTEKAPEPKAPEPQEKPGNVFRVKFDTSKGPILIEAHRDWAPLGAAQFEKLVKARYFNGARFFRIVPNFVVQFGLAANPAETREWDKAIPDDPVLRTNRGGSLAFATMGPNTRTTQIFINLRTNQALDNQGFAPFAQVIEGMDVVEKLYSGYGELPDQGAITKFGNAYLMKEFPKLDYIKTAEVL